MDVRTATQYLINLVYPLHCLLCQKTLDALDPFGVCETCRQGARSIPLPRCVICGSPTGGTDAPCRLCQRTRPVYTRAFSAFVYDGPVKELIHLFKYNRKQAAGRALEELLQNALRTEHTLLDGIDRITCVPIRRLRAMKRGFNQSRELAQALAKTYHLPFGDMLVKRLRTRPQNELSREERRTNLVGAFHAINRGQLRGRRILLVDDVMTTGATLGEASRALIAGGAQEVRCLTLAQSLEHKGVS